MAKLFANTGDPDQMPHSAASDQALHCLPVTLFRVPRLQWFTALAGYTIILNLPYIFGHLEFFTIKCEQDQLTLMFCLKCCDGIANIVDPDQTSAVGSMVYSVCSDMFVSIFRDRFPVVCGFL